jgi:phenylalanyl-tRNA synthetase alpha chain
VAELPAEERGPVGRAANEARKALEALVAERRTALERGELDSRLAADRIDVTLPGDPPHSIGRLHLLTATWREIEDVFMGLGFRVAEGPEIETVYYNFDALNHSPTHPSRLASDTFYTRDGAVLRTHTSPMQVRAMELGPPPLYIVVPGRTYRRDNDATHTPQFHQVEGLAVDEDITLADLQGTLLAFARAIFGDERDVRLRPHFFPFTEPSIECDVSCFNCRGGLLRDGSRCPLCKGTAWIEILGAGMVDPNVFGYVREHGYDPERVQGFAFGMGIERIAFLKHGVPDLRMFFENDLRLLEQFG